MSQTGPLNEPGSMIGSGAGASQMSAVFGPQTGSNESDARSLAGSEGTERLLLVFQALRSSSMSPGDEKPEG